MGMPSSGSTLGLADADGYNPREIARIQRIVEANRLQLKERWRDFFGY